MDVMDIPDRLRDQIALINARMAAAATAAVKIPAGN